MRWQNYILDSTKAQEVDLDLKNLISVHASILSGFMNYYSPLDHRSSTPADISPDDNGKDQVATEQPGLSIPQGIT